MTRAGGQLAVLLACLTSLAATGSRADTPPPDVEAPATRPAGKSIDQLLADLSNDDWKLRQQAADALGDLDAAHLSRLRQVAEGTSDPDIRNAVFAAIRRIEQTVAASPSLITLSYKDAPAIDVLNAIGQQLSYPIATENDEWLKGVKVSIEAKDQPFWSVMKQLAPQWPARPVPTANDPTRLMLGGSGTNYLTARSAVAGPFLVCPVTLITNGQFDLLPDKPAVRFRNMNLQLMVLAEPKVRVSRITVTAKQAVDENGKVLQLAEGMMGMQPTFAAGPQLIMLPLRIQGETGKTLAKLSGVVRARVPSRLRHVELNDALGATEQTVELSGKQVKVLVKQRDDVYNVRLQVPTLNGAIDEATQTTIRDLTVVDDQGQPLFRRSMSQAPNVRPNVWEYTLVFAREGTSFGRQNRKVGEPAKLIWDLAVEPKELDVPFELADIPMNVQ